MILNIEAIKNYKAPRVIPPADQRRAKIAEELTPLYGQEPVYDGDVAYNQVRILIDNFVQIGYPNFNSSNDKMMIENGGNAYFQPDMIWSSRSCRIKETLEIVYLILNKEDVDNQVKTRGSAFYIACGDGMISSMQQLIEFAEITNGRALVSKFKEDIIKDTIKLNHEKLFNFYYQDKVNQGICYSVEDFLKVNEVHVISGIIFYLKEVFNIDDNADENYEKFDEFFLIDEILSAFKEMREKIDFELKSIKHESLINRFTDHLLGKLPTDGKTFNSGDFLNKFVNTVLSFLNHDDIDLEITAQSFYDDQFAPLTDYAARVKAYVMLYLDKAGFLTLLTEERDGIISALESKPEDGKTSQIEFLLNKFFPDDDYADWPMFEKYSEQLILNKSIDFKLDKLLNELATQKMAINNKMEHLKTLSEKKAQFFNNKVQDLVIFLDDQKKAIDEFKEEMNEKLKAININNRNILNNQNQEALAQFNEEDKKTLIQVKLAKKNVEEKAQVIYEHIENNKLMQESYFLQAINLEKVLEVPMIDKEIELTSELSAKSEKQKSALQIEENYDLSKNFGKNGDGINITLDNVTKDIAVNDILLKRPENLTEEKFSNIEKMLKDSSTPLFTKKLMVHVLYNSPESFDGGFDVLCSKFVDTMTQDTDKSENFCELVGICMAHDVIVGA